MEYHCWGGGVRTDPPNPGSAQKSENSSTLGLDYELNKNYRIFLLDTIQEPLERGFQNTPYFAKSDNLAYVMALQSSGIFKILTKSLIYVIFWKFSNFGQPPTVSELSLTKVRGVFKTSFQWLLNGI